MRSFFLYLPDPQAGKCCLTENERAFRKALSLVPEGERTAWVKAKKEAMTARVKHAEECKTWIEAMTQDRWDELEDIRQKRRNEISDKLDELGFVEELDYLDSLQGQYGLRPALRMFDEHPDVKVSKPLTQRSWKNIEERLVEYMHEVRAHKTAADRLRVVRDREKVAISSWVQFRLRYPAEKLLPSGTDILSWQKIKAIIELPSSVPTKAQDDVATPPTASPDEEDGEFDEFGFFRIMPKPTIITTISPASFTRVFESMSGFISQWEDKRIRQLGASSMVGTELQDILFSFAPASTHLKELQLAACVFTCEDKSCLHRWMNNYDGFYPMMFYPEFLHHPCNTVKSGHETAADKNVPLNPSFKAPHFPFPYCQRTEWSKDSLFFDGKASRAVKKLLDACGLDYRTMTTKVMDELDPWFVCLKCSYGAKCDGQRPRKVMPWRNAVQHCMLVHWGDGAVTWERIAEESAAEARMLSTTRSISSDVWRCAHCRDSPKEREGKKTEQLMKTHLSDSHDIVGAERGRDYFEAVDCPPPRKASVQMTPKAAEAEG
ncbi:hypothetical protein DFH07DRAFT_496519 [Mycena maculata]|uniref:Uncharacterized protein n=1 Tax=Mycena maculata TaxID=230809 RepID=A0AAD7NDA0_9AGAR|nr:hypothetical protein DFH07DRAFT_496519 [Mycena maculata]